jgi:peptide/nickel transport system permease protein
MLTYALKRIILMLPTLIGITMITYGVARLAPGDPVQSAMGAEGMEQGSSSREAINQMRVLYGLAYVRPVKMRVANDNPVKGLTQPQLADLLNGVKNWKSLGGPDAPTECFYANVDEDGLWKNVGADLKLTGDEVIDCTPVADVDEAMKGKLGAIGFDVEDVKGNKAFALIGGGGEALQATSDDAKAGKYRLRHYSDKPLVLGYVEWISSVLQGDFGISTKDQRPVAEKIKAALKPTLILSILSILIAYLVAIPIGVRAAVEQNSFFDRSSTVILFILYSLPSFWVALLGIFFFGGGDWWNLVPIRGLGGEAAILDTELVRSLVIGLTMAVPLPIIMGISDERRTRLVLTTLCALLALALLHFVDGMPGFAVVGVLVFAGITAAASWAPQGWLRSLITAGAALICIAAFPVASGDASGALVPWLDRVWHLLLPVTCLSYASFAAISRFQRTSLLEVIRQDFVRTARAKGLPEKVVVWKHAVRNALIPIVTLLGATLPALVGGAVIIETIFTIPGLGMVGFDAILNRDYSVVMAIALMSAVLTMFGILVSDLTYALVDPRINYDD